MAEVVASIIEVRDAASAPLGTIAANATKTATALDGASTAGAKMATTADGKLTPAMGKASAAGRVLGIQMIDVGQQLAAGQAPMSILIQQGGQVAQQFAAMGISLGALAVPLAAVAAGAAVLGGAWFALNLELKAAEANMAAAAKAATEMQKATTAIKGVQQDLSEELAVLVGALTDHDIAYRRSTEAVNEAVGAERAILDARLKAASAALESAQAQKINTTEQRKAYEAALQDVAALERKRAGLLGMAAQIRDVGKATDEAAEADKAAAAAAREHEKAVRELEMAERDLADLHRELDQYNYHRNDQTQENLNREAAIYQEAWGKILQARQQFVDNMEAIQYDAANNTLPEMTEGMMSDSFGSVVSGDVPGMAVNAMSALGYAGAGPVGVALGGLESLGETGAEATLDDMSGQLANIATGMEELPDLLANLPLMFLEHLPELIRAQYEMIFRLAITLPFEIAANIGTVVKEWWEDMGGLTGIARSVKDGLTDWFREAWASIKAWFAGLTDLSDYTLGDNIEKLGNWILSGEATTSAPSTAGTPGPRGLRSAAGSSRGTTVNVNMTAAAFHPDFAVAIEKDLKRIFGANGLRSSPLFGGA